MKKSQFLEALKVGLKSINEVSPEVFQSASGKMQDKSQNKRSMSLGNTFFNKFIGKTIFGGNITNMDFSQGVVYIGIEKVIPNQNGDGNITKKGFVAKYDVKEDSYTVQLQCTRIDARILALIAQKINPNTKYMSGTQDLPVSEY